MAEPSFLSFGDTPHRQDTDWTAAVRWLGRIQNNLTTPLAANNPRRTDSLHRVLEKISSALAGVDCIQCPAFPVPPLCEAAIISGAGGFDGDDSAFNLVAMGANGTDAVAVGLGGEILNSPDGQTWTAQTSGTSDHLYSVAYGAGTWVVVGDEGIVLTSPNMTAWTDHSIGGANTFFGVAFNDGLFVAADVSGNIYSSPDGEVWTLEQSFPEVFYNLIFGGGLFVAVGSGGVLVTSPDGHNWTEQTSGISEDLYDVAYQNGVWVAISGESLSVIYSSDGEAWQTTTIPSSDTTIYAVAGGDDLFLTVTQQSGEAWVSRDGATWTQQLPNLCPDVTMVDFYGDCQFNVNFPSLPGSDCSGLNVAWDLDAPFAVQDLVVNGDFSVEVGTNSGGSGNARIRTTENGICWTTRTPPVAPSPSPLWGVAYGNSIYMAVGSARQILTSPDGITWTLQPPLGDPVVIGVHRTEVSDVAFGLGMFVALVNRDDIAVNIATDFFTSTDGTSWTLRQTVNHAGAFSITNVNFQNGIFMALGGDNDLLYTSSDGIVWTQQTVPTSGNTFQESAYGNGVWVVTMDDSNVIVSNDNGASWSLVAVPEQTYSIDYGNGQFVLEQDGGGNVYTSPDGSVWTLADAGPGNAVVRYYRDCTFFI